MARDTINLSPPLAVVRAEAERMGISPTALLTADIVRYRRMAEDATPNLDDWQWALLSHVWDGIEAMDILTGRDDLPPAIRIAAEIDTWADAATDEECLRAGELRKLVMTWTPLMIAGALMRLRREAKHVIER